MLTNAIVLTVLCVVVCIIAKEESRNIRNWISKDRTEAKYYLEQVVLFWKEIGKNWIRDVALIAILVVHRDIWGMIISLALLIGMSYKKVKKFDIFNRIQWEAEETQQIATASFIALALFMLLDRVSLLNIIYNIIVVSVLVVAGLVFFWWIFNRKKDKDDDVSTDVPYDDLEDDEDEDDDE